LNAKKIVRVGHTCLEVFDIAAAKVLCSPIRRNWTSVILEEGDSVGWRNESFAIFLTKPEARLVSKKMPGEDEFVTADHVAFLLDDRDEVDAMAAFMQKCGFGALFPPEEHTEFVPGYYSVSYSDPDNNVLELYCTS